MQTEVLRYIHTDYEVIIRTQDISYSWERFEGRIRYSREQNPDIDAPDHYCRYTSKDECLLRLYRPDSQSVETFSDQKSKQWDKLPPVVFETCKYQIRILFRGVDKNSQPEIRHVRKDVEDSFYFDDETKDKTDKSITGELDFLNEPGVFKLDFSYHKNGVRHDCFVTFDVVSPKLDTKNDYKTLLREVNREYENVIYRYLSITVQQFSRGQLNTDASWMDAFQSVVDDYVKNIKRIIQNPHSQTVDYVTSRRADHIKHWTPAMEELYAELSLDPSRLEEYYFRYNESQSTHDTLENRFVKHTLSAIGKKLTSVIANVLNKNQAELSERHRLMWTDYLHTLQKLSKNQFFKTIGRFEGLRYESLVLQSRSGYQQIYKDWLKLKRGIDLYNGAANIGTLQIWEIYELWCFVKVKQLVAEVLGIQQQSYERFVTEPKGTLLNPFTDSSLEHIVEYRYPEPQESDSEERKEQLSAHQGDIVTLHYQHTFNRASGGDIYGFNTATTEQRPDIVLNIRRQSGEVVLTYLYDAKYRVINDKKLDRDFEKQDITENSLLPGGDYPPTDAINQMHRYRDAIYYSPEHEKYRSKEIIGGYILFPGRGDDQNISQRYYSASAESVNIGAFPLLPNSSALLQKHLEDILMHYTTDAAHVSKAKPQRTLAYITEEEKLSIPTDDLVMVAISGNEQKRQWAFDKKWYNIPLDKIADSPWMQAKYILLIVGNETITGNLHRIVKSRHDVWTKETLIENGYPETPSHSAYFMMGIQPLNKEESALKNLQFNVKANSKYYWGSPRQVFYLVKLKDLIEAKAEMI